jgi:hypothetical protein
VWGGCYEVLIVENCRVCFTSVDITYAEECGVSLTYPRRNIVTVNMMEAVGEAQVFAEKTGLGTGPMEELIGEAFGPVAGGYSKRYVFLEHMRSLKPDINGD